MPSLFESADRASLEARLRALQPESPRQWGKMNAAQMLAHCCCPLEAATHVRPSRQRWLGKVIAPLVRKGALGDRPFSKSSPTDPTFVVSDAREFDRERARLLELMDQFVAKGPESAAQVEHSFFGRLNGDEWGRLSYKHLDHHLRQFGV